MLSESFGLLALCQRSMHPTCLDHERGKAPMHVAWSRVAAGAGLWNWVTPTACLRGQLVPVVWAVGQVDFSTGGVLPVSSISVCSFSLTHSEKLIPVSGVTKGVTTSPLMSAEKTQGAKAFLVLKIIEKALNPVSKGCTCHWRDVPSSGRPIKYYLDFLFCFATS